MLSYLQYIIPQFRVISVFYKDQIILDLKNRPKVDVPFASNKIYNWSKNKIIERKNANINLFQIARNSYFLDKLRINR